MPKTLILVRHAHRDNTDRAVDNGLSEKGKTQAKAIRRFYLDRFSAQENKAGIWLVTSPKIRCQETLAPLAKVLEKAVDLHPWLDEQAGKESVKAFEQRIEDFLAEWRASKMERTILCSHGDWLPLAIQKLLGLSVGLKKGSWVELEWSGTQASVLWWIPTFKHFYT
ncbi:MAG: phosphoglycerate mutase family protein [Bdellovibrionales bacterium]